LWFQQLVPLLQRLKALMMLLLLEGPLVLMLLLLEQLEL
jgi:hypothetical protein